MDTKLLFKSKLGLIISLCGITYTCSFPLSYSVVNKYHEKRHEQDLSDGKNHLGEKQKQVFLNHTNRTIFPSISFWLQQASQKTHSNCAGYSLDLAMTTPQAIDAEYRIMQSTVTLQVLDNLKTKIILFTATEVLTFHSIQGVNEESILQTVVQRLLDQMMFWCVSEA